MWPLPLRAAGRRPPTSAKAMLATAAALAAVMTEDLVAVLRSVTAGDDPVERIGRVAEILGRATLRRQDTVRVVVASTIARPATAKDRPAHRFGLIEQALAPWIDRLGAAGRADAEQLVRGLAVVISAESIFTLTDLCGLPPEAAIASLVVTARAMTAAAPAAPNTD